MTDRRIGGDGVQVDAVPIQLLERQTGAVGLNVDYQFPQGVQFGHEGLSIDLVPSAPSRYAGALGVTVDYVPSISLQVLPDTIGTAALVYQPTITLIAGGTIQPGSISSGEVVFGPTVSVPAALSVYPEAITSAGVVLAVFVPPPPPIGFGRAISMFPGSAVSNISGERVALLVRGSASPPVGTAVGGP